MSYLPIFYRIALLSFGTTICLTQCPWRISDGYVENDLYHITSRNINVRSVGIFWGDVPPRFWIATGNCNCILHVCSRQCLMYSLLVSVCPLIMDKMHIHMISGPNYIHVLPPILTNKLLNSHYIHVPHSDMLLYMETTITNTVKTTIKAYLLPCVTCNNGHDKHTLRNNML